MNIEKIGSRGILFYFYDLGMRTNVYVIVSKDRFYIIDTYLGPDIMSLIDEYLVDNYGEKEKIIINTHSDWDHIWGNCYFDKSIIISHRACYKDIKKNGEIYLLKYKDYKRGKVEIQLPNMLFDQSISFVEDDIDIYYSKGHTVDSITVVDRLDRVLYGGDNLETPIPYVQSIDLLSYKETLNIYLKEDVDIFIGGHTGVGTIELVKENKRYIDSLYIEKNINLFDGYEAHQKNLEFIKNNQ